MKEQKWERRQGPFFKIHSDFKIQICDKVYIVIIPMLDWKFGWNTTPPPLNIHPLHYCHHHHQLNHSTKYCYQYSSVFITVTTIISWIIQPSITISTVQYLLLSPPSSAVIVQEPCESRGRRTGLSVLTSLLVSVDVKIYWTVLRHWSQLVPNMSADIWGH